MALKLGDLAKVPPKQKAFLAVLVCILIVTGYYYLYHRELAAQKDVLQKKVNELDGVIRMQSDIAKNLPSFKVEVRRLEEQLGLLLEQLPDSAEIPSLLKNVSDLGKESGLDFVRFAPGAEIRKDFYDKMNKKAQDSEDYSELREICQENCLHTTHEFHRWLVDKGYLLVRPERKGGN